MRQKRKRRMVANGREIIARGYAAATPVAQIAEEAGTTPQSVRVIAHRMGIRHGSQLSERLPPDRIDEYRFLMRRKHLPAAFIAQVMGLGGSV